MVVVQRWRVHLIAEPANLRQSWMQRCYNLKKTNANDKTYVHRTFSKVPNESLYFPLKNIYISDPKCANEPQRLGSCQVLGLAGEMAEKRHAEVATFLPDIS